MTEKIENNVCSEGRGGGGRSRKGRVMWRSFATECKKLLKLYVMQWKNLSEKFANKKNSITFLLMCFINLNSNLFQCFTSRDSIINQLSAFLMKFKIFKFSFWLEKFCTTWKNDKFPAVRATGISKSLEKAYAYSLKKVR